MNDEEEVEEITALPLDGEDIEARRAAQRDTVTRIAGIVARLEGIAVTRPLTHKEARQLEGWKSCLRRKETGE